MAASNSLSCSELRSELESTMEGSTSLSMDTVLIHGGEPIERICGGVTMPIFRSATYLQRDGEVEYDDNRYIRLSNTPNHIALAEKLALLCHAEAAMVTASGMAAISTAILTVCQAGDHLLAQDNLYGGTLSFVSENLKKLGVEVTFISSHDTGSWNDKVKPNTKAVYVETMTNPLLNVVDLEEVVKFAKRNNIVSMIDNTFASPYNFRPLDHGFDVELHSCSKYLNGHTDVVAGAVLGRKAFIKEFVHNLIHFGGSADPQACYLLHRGMKTLTLRMKQHNESALKIAQFLEQHPCVRRVNYPGLESHSSHILAKKLFVGCSGMLCFELNGGKKEALTFMKHLKLPLYAPSLGGVDSLITLPSTSTHAGMSQEARAKLGISENLIRLSVGIEGTEDLIADIKQALNATFP